ncbi:MAG TPA: LuxR C-terminal-related transcriptional regulator [Candidatus Dormibacteraeota bacterium]
MTGGRREGAAAGQKLGFFDHRGRRVAYATAGGRGTPLLCDLGRIQHLDVFWRYPPYRRLVEALAGHFMVIRVDRPGCGLSDRGGADFSIDGELTLFDRLLDELDLDDTAILSAGTSAPASIATAALRPRRVSRLAVFGACARHVPETGDYGSSIEVLLRTRFELATEVLARERAAGSDAAAVRWLAAAYRESAPAEVMVDLVRESRRLDARPLLGRVRCPTLVLHRRDDPSVPFQCGRDVAAGIRGAVLLPVDGAAGLIWEGDVESLLAPAMRFLSDGGEPGPPVPGPSLTAREREVGRLVAAGLTNTDIAQRLGIGRRTVESHVEHARNRLGLVSRAELAAWIMRERDENAR